MNQTARSLAIANENRQIEESTARAVAARESKPRSALETLASRLQIQPAELKSTLVKTVFAGCRTESEFLALIIVANEYGLNPLTKEIYAFPAKGGGVVPMVSIDGWIRIMNEHPQYDGIDFNYQLDEKGNVEAIESVIYRKDRTRPTKVLEWLDECKRNTDPWNKSPKRMLRHRALMQGARVAFGFSSIAIEEDALEGVYTEVPTLPARQEFSGNVEREPETIDTETGEVLPTDSRGFTEVDEETARALDAKDGTLSDDNPTAAEGPDDSRRGEPEPEAQQESSMPKWIEDEQRIVDHLNAASAKSQVDAAERDFLNIAATFPDDVRQRLEGDIRAARKRVAAKATA